MSPDLAIYIFKQVKVKMTLDLVMSHVKHEASHSVPMIQVTLVVNKSESVYEEFE